MANSSDQSGCDEKASCNKLDKVTGRQDLANVKCYLDALKPSVLRYCLLISQGCCRNAVKFRLDVVRKLPGIQLSRSKLDLFDYEY